MIRVLFVTDSLMSGGVESQLTALATRLDKTRFEVRILTLYGEKAGRSLHFLDILTENGIPVDVLNLNWGAMDKAKGIAGIVKAAWSYRPHIIHAHNYHANLLTRMARLLLPPSSHLIGAVRNQYTPIQLRNERLSWRFCRLIVANSPMLIEQLHQDAKVPPSRVKLVYNGLDMQRFDAEPPHQIREQIAPHIGRLFLLIGRISKQKSPHLFVSAMGKLKDAGQLPDDVHVLILGEVEANQQEHQILLDEAIAQYGLSERVHQHPFTATPEDYYHACDVCALTSLWEGLPNAMLESLAVGRPVLISEVANNAGVVQDAVNGWIVKTGDVDSIAQGIRRVLALHSDELKAMQSACKQSVVPFSMEKMISTYQDLYQDIAHS